LNESSTIPHDTDGELIFTVTHPFPPLFGQQLPLVAQRCAWGEPRVFFHDPTTGRLRSLPTAWTNLAPPDPLVVLAAERAILRFTDLQTLTRLLHDVEETLREVPQ
jgi:hypothetical protein